MSDTPRTDAVKHGFTVDSSQNSQYRLTNLAQQLERELNEANADRLRILEALQNPTKEILKAFECGFLTQLGIRHKTRGKKRRGDENLSAECVGAKAFLQAVYSEVKSGS